MSAYKIPYTFTAELWQYQAAGGWYFISIPKTFAAEIRSHSASREEGWGRLKVKARIGQTTWDTAMWYDTKHATYLLPVKALVRKQENISLDQSVQIDIWV
jgi:hypothetical protein